MANKGDDCYFFLNATCAKGDSCPFRHCEAASGCEVVCCLWQENRCFRQVCKFRHVLIKKNRKKIACYFENQPAGCQKPHCAFHHEKPRIINGLYVPSNKSLALKEEEEPHEDPSPLVSTPIPSPANPQIHGVINPSDDEDEEEHDQFSEGEDNGSSSDGSRVVSPRKIAMASSSGYTIPGQASDQRNNGASGEKEIMRSFIHPSLFTAKDEVPAGGDLSMKRYLAKHFGRKMGEDETEHPPQKVPDTITSTRAPKRSVTAKPATSLHVKTFSEILHAKRKLEEDLQQGQGPSLRKANQQAVEAAPGNSQACGPTHPAMPMRVAPPVRGVKVKTLEEIRSAKAARMQDQGQEASNGKRPGSASGEGGAKKPCILHINKPASPAASTTTQKISEVTEKPAESAAVATEEEQASEGSAKAESAQTQAADSALQREKSMTSIIMRVIPSATSSPHTITLEVLAQAPKAPLCQRITLKPKAASHVLCATAFPQQGSPLKQAEADPHSLSSRSSSAAPGKRKRGSPGGASPPKQAALAAATDSPGRSVDEDLVEKAQDGSQKKSPGQATEVRSKLNMRPSVMKQAVQIKPGQKGQKRTRKSADTYAVAAVNSTPLNSTSAAQEELLQEPPCKRKECRGPDEPCGSLESSLRPCGDVHSAMEAPSASSSSSAMDEFDERMKKFLGYYHEFNCELDPG
ncbi:zinc finger CCCH domain-containing protein 11A-like [Coregonus clupeaformis]|uniref:zinc finger CCCH domain-containing protein 11A-like n=1 Tax=Coregonus clupeaformis TaxID=59861 RepID=UPI001E1C8537|nr:zinc finger CCCH domain-containing protein 11A-like [Coregonus clupeaformis]